MLSWICGWDNTSYAFCTHLSHYKFPVMPFCLSIAHATFQATMNNILAHTYAICVDTLWWHWLIVQVGKNIWCICFRYFDFCMSISLWLIKRMHVSSTRLGHLSLRKEVRMDTKQIMWGIPDFLRHSILNIALSWGLGEVFMQFRRPIAYFSEALSKWNLAKPAYEKEMMVLLELCSATLTFLFCL